MNAFQRYAKTSAITAVQFNLQTAGFVYNKWGGEQQCKQGDWLVDNDGDIYTVDKETFAKTYRLVANGRYAKSVAVYAEVAETDGSVRTKEGVTNYKSGDYLVYNEAESGDPYAIEKDTFLKLYERV